MTTDKLLTLSTEHEAALPSTSNNWDEGGGWREHIVSEAYEAGFTKQNQLAIALLQQKQAEAQARWIAHGNTSDNGILNILRELLEELTIQP